MERTESLLGVEDVAAQGVEVLDVANVRWAEYFLKCLDRRGRLCWALGTVVFALVFFLPFVTLVVSVGAAPWAKRQAWPKLHRPAK